MVEVAVKTRGFIVTFHRSREVIPGDVPVVGSFMRSCIGEVLLTVDTYCSIGLYGD